MPLDTFVGSCLLLLLFVLIVDFVFDIYTNLTHITATILQSLNSDLILRLSLHPLHKFYFHFKTFVQLLNVILLIKFED